MRINSDYRSPHIMHVRPTLIIESSHVFMYSLISITCLTSGVLARFRLSFTRLTSEAHHRRGWQLTPFVACITLKVVPRL